MLPPSKLDRGLNEHSIELDDRRLLSANGIAMELAPGRTRTVGHGVAILTYECARHA